MFITYFTEEKSSLHSGKVQLKTPYYVFFLSNTFEKDMNSLIPAAYYNSTVHRFNHYTMRTPPILIGNQKLEISILKLFTRLCKSSFVYLWYI